MSAVAQIYAKKILKGEKTIDDVPEVIREEVTLILKNGENHGMVCN